MSFIDPSEWSSILEECHKSCEFISWLKQDAIRREANKAFYEARPHILRMKNIQDQKEYSIAFNEEIKSMPADTLKQELEDRKMAMKLYSDEVSRNLAIIANEELSLALARRLREEEIAELNRIR